MIIIDNKKNYANLVITGKHGIDSTRDLLASDIKANVFEFGDVYMVDSVDASIDWIREDLMPELVAEAEGASLDVWEQGEYELGYECELRYGKHGEDGEESFYFTSCAACDKLESVIDNDYYKSGFVSLVLMTRDEGETLFRNLSDCNEGHCLVTLDELRRVHELIK